MRQLMVPSGVPLEPTHGRYVSDEWQDFDRQTVYADSVSILDDVAVTPPKASWPRLVFHISSAVGSWLKPQRIEDCRRLAVNHCKAEPLISPPCVLPIRSRPEPAVTPSKPPCRSQASA